jgi:hypothetical protein
MRQLGHTLGGGGGQVPGYRVGAHRVTCKGGATAAKRVLSEESQEESLEKKKFTIKGKEYIQYMMESCDRRLHIKRENNRKVQRITG